jgi:Fe2+ transport system protein FeoA
VQFQGARRIGNRRQAGPCGPAGPQLVVAAGRGTRRHREGRERGERPTDRLLALGVTPGAQVVALQTFPGFVVLCDQTELTVECVVADAILVRRVEGRS